MTKKARKEYNQTIRHQDILSPLIVFMVIFFIYLHHLSPSVFGGDAGDFLSAISVFGVPHPSGYPLYTLLGILFNALPLGHTTAWRVDLLSALLSSGTVTLIYFLVEGLTKQKIVSIITAFSFAFLFPFWLFSEVTEVFALHLFFLMLLFFLGTRFSQTGTPKYLLLLSFFFGLSFSHHEQTVLLLPSLLVFIGPKIRTTRINFKTMIQCAGLFLVGLLPYLYIPIAASHNPPVNWDHASTFNNFLHLLTRADYGWKSAGTNYFSIEWLSLKWYFLYFVSEIPVIVLLCLPFGIWSLIRKKYSVFLLATITAFLLFGPIFFFYDAFIPEDIYQFGLYEKFYIASLLFPFFLLPFGILWIKDALIMFLFRISPLFKTKPFYKVLFTAMFFVIPLSLFFRNVYKTDLHQLHIGDMLGKDALASLPENSFVIIRNDDLQFSLRYIEYATKTRTDVTSFTTDEFRDYLLTHFARDQILKRMADNQVLDTRSLTHFTIRDETHPLFLTIPTYINDIQYGPLPLIPYGFFFKIMSKDDTTLSEDMYLKKQNAILTNMHVSKLPNPEDIAHLKLMAEIPLYYSTMYANTGFFLMTQYHDPNKAKSYFEKAKTLYPDSDVAYEGLGNYALSKNNCREAEAFYEKTISLNTQNFRSYVKLYKAAILCHDTKTVLRMKTYLSNYPSLFK